MLCSVSRWRTECVPYPPVVAQGLHGVLISLASEHLDGLTTDLCMSLEFLIDCTWSMMHVLVWHDACVVWHVALEHAYVTLEIVVCAHAACVSQVKV